MSRWGARDRILSVIPQPAMASMRDSWTLASSQNLPLNIIGHTFPVSCWLNFGGGSQRRGWRSGLRLGIQHGWLSFLFWVAR